MRATKEFSTIQIPFELNGDEWPFSRSLAPSLQPIGDRLTTVRASERTNESRAQSRRGTWKTNFCFSLQFSRLFAGWRAACVPPPPPPAHRRRTSPESSAILHLHASSVSPASQQSLFASSLEDDAACINHLAALPLSRRRRHKLHYVALSNGYSRAGRKNLPQCSEGKALGFVSVGQRS